MSERVLKRIRKAYNNVPPIDEKSYSTRPDLESRVVDPVVVVVRVCVCGIVDEVPNKNGGKGIPQRRGISGEKTIVSFVEAEVLLDVEFEVCKQMAACLEQGEGAKEAEDGQEGDGGLPLPGQLVGKLVYRTRRGHFTGNMCDD